MDIFSKVLVNFGVCHDKNHFFDFFNHAKEDLQWCWRYGHSVEELPLPQEGHRGQVYQHRLPGAAQ